MLSSDILFELVTRLQRSNSVTHGRRALLNFVCTSTNAQAVLLFLLNKQTDTLHLLEWRGCKSLQSLADDERVKREQDLLPPALVPGSDLSPRGLFGSALDSLEPLFVHDPLRDPRCLPAERVWLRESSPIVMCEVGQKEGLEGVLIVCFNSEQELESSELQTPEGRGNFLICCALCSAYLSSPPVPVTDDEKTEAETSLIVSTPAPASPAENLLTILRNHEQRQSEIKAAIEQERGRIARDIHDSSAQKFTYVLHKLEYVQRIFEARPEEALKEIATAYDAQQEGLQELRQNISSLLPTYLTDQSFEVAIQMLLDDYAQSEPRLKIDYQIDVPHLFPANLEVTVFYLLQEALNNIRSHALATQVTVQIRQTPDFLQMQISDNGRGFSPEEAVKQAEAKQHFGLRSMRERVELARGSWSLHSSPDAGTTIKARFPIRNQVMRLTRREREVLTLLREGYTNRAIASMLSISVETVKSHVHHIMQKMQVKDRTQAAVLATQQQWI